MLLKINNWIKNERILVCSSLVLITLLFVPYVYFGEGIHVRIFDNLDSNLIWIKMTLESGGLFTFTSQIDQMMNGLPLHSIYGVYDFSLVIFYIFGWFKGYVISKWLMALIAFIGMYLLLKHHIITDTPPYLYVAIAFLFSLLPFWSYVASVAGVPLVMYAFLNLRKGDKRVINWTILVGYAFWSSLVTTGFFLLIVFTIIWIVDLVISREKNSFLFGGLVCLSLAYIVSHLPLFYTHFLDGYVSMRTEFDKSSRIGILETLSRTFDVFIDGDNLYSRHSVSIHRYSIVPILFVFVLMIRNKSLSRVFIGSLLFVCVSSILYAINDAAFFASTRAILTDVLPMNFARFYWLNPVFWYILLALSFSFLFKRYSWGKYIILIIFLVQLMMNISHMDYVFYKKNEGLKYEQFYSEKQLNDIAKYIDRPQNSYRVMSIGIEPAISIYNGFHTLDGFSIDYPLEYKHEFRKIIAGELNLSEGFKRVFDNWGGRCYLFIDGVYVNFHSYKPKIERKLKLDYEQIIAMKGEYILSACEIDESMNPRLQLLKCFHKNDYDTSFWNIYLYEVLKETKE